MDSELARTILIRGFSKTFSITGLRIGYAISNVVFVEAMTRLHEQTATCTCSLSQHAAIRVLDTELLSDHNQRVAAEYERCYSLFTGILDKHYISTIPEEGTFYAFVRSNEIHPSPRNRQKYCWTPVLPAYRESHTEHPLTLSSDCR